MSLEISTINVVYRGEDVPLEVDLPHSDLRSSHSIRWRFHGVPSGCRASIQFGPGLLNTPDAEAAGPFQHLKHSASGVTGYGNTGLAGEYSYTALVLNHQGVLATSAGTRIDNHSSMEEELHGALAFFAEIEESRFVVVEPTELRVHYGSTIIWSIEEVPADCLVSFIFQGFQEATDGLFSSFSITQEGNPRTAIGTGFSDQIPIGTKIKYCVAVTRDHDSWTVTHDPVIESLGPPPNRASHPVRST